MTPPYYINPLIRAFRQSSGEERLLLGRRIAATVCDPVALRAILGIDPEEFRSFYPDMTPPVLSTDDTIDSFLIRYGNPQAPHSSEITPLEEFIPVDPAPFDLSELEKLPEAFSGSPADDTSSLLDSFLSTSARKPSGESPRRPETPILSESLAKAMIKNGNYSKALEIITDLSLNNPKKSIYFADQIRFLKKLILNQSKGPLPN